MLNIFLVVFGKIISNIFKRLNLGNGSTWPGHIALSVNRNFVKELLKDSKTKIIIVAGTNGKTTTSSLIKNSLRDNGNKIIQNESGANLLNGIASTLILNSNLSGKIVADYAIFEIDENTLPQILENCNPDYIILLNLFRDQLDRYGEINTIATKWRDALDKLNDQTTLILNADDPQIAFLNKNIKAKVLYFGLDKAINNNTHSDQTSDSGYCPNCGNKLNYSQVIFSHLGIWNCIKCGLKGPIPDISHFSVYPLPGIYNIYNSLACVLLLRSVGIIDKNIKNSFSEFKPAFGRQEIIIYKNKKIQVFLSKNPTSFNQSYQTISALGAKTLIIILNDRIPDGRDISWIWDVDLPGVKEFKNVILSGDRVYDLALRLKYDECKNFQTCDQIDKAINRGIELIDEKETLFILPTYSAMLETRKILTGKKIL